MEKKSFIRKTMFLMGMQFAITILVLLLFIMYSYHTAMENMTGNMENLLQIFGQELTNKTTNANRVLERLIYKNTDYDMLQSAKEADRYYAAIELRDLMEETIIYDSYIDAIVIAESEYETCLERENTAISLKQRNELQAFTLESAGTGHRKAEWTIEQIGDVTYIYKMYVWQGRAAGVFMSVDSFMKTAADSDYDRISLLLADKEGTVWACYGNACPGQETGTVIGELPGHAAQKSSYPLADGKMMLYSYVSITEIMSQIQANMLGMLFVILISIVAVWILILTIRKEIIGPMKNMTESMDKIGQGDYGLRIAAEYHNSEFSMLKNTFNRLMDEIVGLKIKSYEKQIELQETELKCVRLQIRPHFFLNAMTTISSLSMQGRNGEIKTYIDALSKNIRYMFQSGLHTVMLGEEIRHVENYFEMQELKYPACVFYFIEIDPEVENWHIPQMIIHTIIENEYKYAIALDCMLTILIKARKGKKDGEEMLFLEIEDDGKGYPKDVLQQFGKKEAEGARDGKRVGLFSVRRMMELMYEKEDLFSISNIEPHGCVNRFWIPKRPVHEVGKELLQHKID